MKIGIMGYYPPPFGGISIHVQRLGKYLDKNQINYRIYSKSNKDYINTNIRLFSNRRKWALLYLLGKKEDIIHCHIVGWTERVFYLIVAKAFFKKIIFTFHSFADNKSLNFIQKIAYKLTIKYADAYIAVSDENFKEMLLEGVDKDKLYLIPGFIAPKDGDCAENSLTNGKHKGLLEFIQKHDNLICANSSNLRFYNNEDLYGIDMCIDLVKDLVDLGYKNIGFIFAMPQPENITYLIELKNRIKNYNIEENFIFIYDCPNFYNVIKMCNLFVRPTNTDGDSISIRESLHFGVKVVTSDVAKRPDGCIVFESRNRKDFLNKVTLAIKDTFKDGCNFSSNAAYSYEERILGLYRKLAKDKQEGKNVLQS
jgi:glycosyltransferase involved in cell wall biosynthesis